MQKIKLTACCVRGERREGGYKRSAHVVGAESLSHWAYVPLSLPSSLPFQLPTRRLSPCAGAAGDRHPDSDAVISRC